MQCSRAAPNAIRNRRGGRGHHFVRGFHGLTKHADKKRRETGDVARRELEGRGAGPTAPMAQHHQMIARMPSGSQACLPGVDQQCGRHRNDFGGSHGSQYAPIRSVRQPISPPSRGAQPNGAMWRASTPASATPAARAAACTTSSAARFDDRACKLPHTVRIRIGRSVDTEQLSGSCSRSGRHP